MTAVLITIGDEILSGNTVDSNSNFIAAELRKIGISVTQILTVSDEIPAIEKALSTATEIAEIVITTGGLGPTKDDRTKTAFANFFTRKIVYDAASFEHLKRLLIKRNREHLLEINRPQAEILEGAKVFQNENGTAPCQMILHNGKMIFSLPGVPYEVKPLIKSQIIPYLADSFNLENIVTRSISIVDFPENALSQHIEAWELSLPESISLSYLPIGNRIKLRLTASGKNKFELNQILDAEIAKLKPLIRNKVIAWDGNEIQEILGGILTEKYLKISVAESCTGGEIQRLMTSVPGCSAYFEGGITAYSEHQKTKILGVPKDIISKNSVVSAEVSEAMALGCQNLFKTDISVATTGVAGPSGDDYGTEIGTVFYSIIIGKTTFTNRLFLPHLERRDFMNFVAQRVSQDVVEILSKNV